MKQIVELNDLYRLLGYRFNDEQLIITALTHSSYANEAKKIYHSMSDLNF